MSLLLLSIALLLILIIKLNKTNKELHLRLYSSSIYLDRRKQDLPILFERRTNWR